jgi:predicted protein tyrosine phosphatase
MKPPVTRPIPDSYVVPGTLLAAGEYPGSAPGTPTAKAEQKLSAFLDVGISAFVDLTDPDDGLAPYAPVIRELGAARGVDVFHDQLTIRDMRTCTPSHMRQVLDVVDAHIAAERGVYVHCWGGIGRTGMVVGCWLVRQGWDGEAALIEVGRLFRTMSPAKVGRHESWGSPQTDAQRNVVRSWVADPTGAP